VYWGNPFDASTADLSVTISKGGGIWIESGSGVIENNTINGNFARYGGGIYSNGSFAITNNVIANNTGMLAGGAIYSNNSDSIITGNEFRNNYGLMGGALFTRPSGLSTPQLITNNVFSGNLGTYLASAIWVQWNQALTISNNIFYANNSGSTTIQLDSNSFYPIGENFQSISILNNLFYYNSGGTISSDDVIEGVISRNNLVHSNSSSVYVINNIFAHNTQPSLRLPIPPAADAYSDVTYTSFNLFFENEDDGDDECDMLVYVCPNEASFNILEQDPLLAIESMDADSDGYLDFDFSIDDDANLIPDVLDADFTDDYFTLLLESPALGAGSSDLNMDTYSDLDENPIDMGPHGGLYPEW
jgi:hypothetical protein